MAEDDAKKKGKMIDFTTDHHQKEDSGDDVSVNQGDPGDSSTMKEYDANKQKMIGSTSDHLQKDSSDDSSTIALMKEGDPRDAMELFTEGDPSDAMELLNEDDPSGATDLMNAIMSTPKKRKEPTTSIETPSKIRIGERWTPSKTTTAATVKHFHKINVKVPKKETKYADAVGGAAAAAAGNHNSDSDSDASSILFIERQRCSSPTSGLLPKAPPETDGKN